MAAKFNARLELLHVIDWRFLVGHFVSHFTEVFRHEGGESFTERVERYYREYGESLVERAKRRCLERGVTNCTATVEAGKVAKQIIERANGADLLVIGQRGETEDRGPGFLGSVAERVVRSVETTALVVQPPVRAWRRAAGL